MKKVDVKNSNGTAQRSTQPVRRNSQAPTVNELLAENQRLKSKVDDLEKEIHRLKQKQEQLRKAKSNTIVKREREVLEVGLPFSKRTSTVKAEPDCGEAAVNINKLEDENEQNNKNIAWLRAKVLALEEMLEKEQKKEALCGHEPILLQLQQEADDYRNDCSALQLECTQLRTRISDLETKLSVKEANWCELEEQYKEKLKKTFGEKYHEWMVETESKLAVLQQANETLQSLLAQRENNDT